MLIYVRWIQKVFKSAYDNVITRVVAVISTCSRLDTAADCNLIPGNEFQDRNGEGSRWGKQHIVVKSVSQGDILEHTLFLFYENSLYGS